MMVVLALSLAGGAGAALRLGVQELCGYWGRSSAFSLLLINSVGSFAAGVMAGVSTELGPLWAMVGTGFLGGFTTMSAAAVLHAESVLLARKHAAVAQRALASLLLGLMALLSFAAAGLGLVLTSAS